MKTRIYVFKDQAGMSNSLKTIKYRIIDFLCIQECIETSE